MLIQTSIKSSLATLYTPRAPSMGMSLPSIPASIPCIGIRNSISSLYCSLCLFLLIFLLLSQHLCVQLRRSLCSLTHAVHRHPTSCGIHCTLCNTLSLLHLMDGLRQLVGYHTHDLLWSSLWKFGFDLLLEKLYVRDMVLLKGVLAHAWGASLARRGHVAAW